jgi:hypothetical protein
MKNLIQYSRSFGWDFDSRTPKYDEGMLVNIPGRSVNIGYVLPFAANVKQLCGNGVTLAFVGTV